MPTSTNGVDVQLNERSYSIAIGHDLLKQTGELLQQWCANRDHLQSGVTKVLIVADANVAKHWLDPVMGACRESAFQVDAITVPSGEETKSFAKLQELYDFFVSHKADRRTIVIALGGGVTGDLTGFAAASFNRGMPFVQIPTTLLSQVDSSVGGKVGINHPQGKNLIGAFHQPLGVIIDVQTLATLPERDFHSGMAEVVKYGMILDADFFKLLQENREKLMSRDPAILNQVISRSCRLKADVVEEDEYERSGLRAILNYGHTFAHAYENLLGYGELLHGEAVAIGMIDASRLAQKLGRIEDDVTQQQIELLDQLDLPTSLPSGHQLTPESVLEAMRLDKKNVAGKLRFILPTRIGHVEMVRDVEEALVLEILKERL